MFLARGRQDQVVTWFDGGGSGRGGRVDSPIRETLDVGQRPIDAPCELEGITALR